VIFGMADISTYAVWYIRQENCRINTNFSVKFCTESHATCVSISCFERRVYDLVIIDNNNSFSMLIVARITCMPPPVVVERLYDGMVSGIWPWVERIGTHQCGI